MSPSRPTDSPGVMSADPAARADHMAGADRAATVKGATALARTAVLARVRRAQRTGRIPGMVPGTMPGTVHGVMSTGLRPHAAPPPRETWLARFLAELTALGVEHFVEATEPAVRARVGTIVNGRRVLAWGPDRLPYGVGAILADSVVGTSPRDLQAAAEVGVTGCDGAIAETGSLVLLSGSEQPRTASLLPPVHIAIVRRDDLRFSMGEFFEARAEDLASAACCAFITGPSRTADIELTLTLGVHGPGAVIVIVGP